MAKKLKLKIPKRIAGVKIPKGIRKGPIADFINSSGGQVVIAEALVALGGVLAAKRSGVDVGELLRHPGRAASEISHMAAGRARDARHTVSTESERLATAFREAMRTFRDTLEEGRGLPEGEREASRSKKNRGSSQSGRDENLSTPH